MPLTGPSVADLATEAAKGWLLALIADRPLAGATDVDVEELAREGPDLCHAVLRALASDEEQEWLGATDEGRDLAARAVALTGSAAPQAAVQAVEALRRGVAGALQSAGPLADPASWAAAADRLAHVCAQLAAVAVAVTSAPADAKDSAAPSSPASDEPSAPALTSLPSLRSAPAQASARPLWMAALERQLAEGGRSGRRFALLLLEVDGAERLRLADPAGGDGNLLAGVGRAVRAHVRRADLLAHEDDGRMWVIAPEAGRGGGRALADRLAEAVQRSAGLRGAPITVSIGMSIYPEDGHDAVALTENAEEQMFAARATGRPVAEAPPREPVGGGF